MSKKPVKNHLPDRSQAKQLYDAQLPSYEGALLSFAQTLRTLLEQHGLTLTIKHRIKRFDAWYDKLRKLHVGSNGAPPEQITDLFGLRVVCPFLEDIESVEKLVAERFKVIETVRKANQHSFREFGYDSLHQVIRIPGESQLKPLLPGTVATCEIQLRTILQDAWAEVEHELVYKSDIALPNESVRRKLASLNATLTLSDLIFQELRDYQKELRQRHRQRRASISETIRIDEDLTVPAPPEPSSPFVPLPKAALSSSLEKTIIEALDAHSRRDFATAIRLYDQLLGMKLKPPVRALVYNHRGMARFALGDYRSALQDFSRSVHYNPNYTRGFINRGLCHRVLKRHQRSLSDYAAALVTDPACADALFGRAQTYYEMKLFSQALGDCEQVLLVDPGHQAASNLLGCIRGEIL